MGPMAGVRARVVVGRQFSTMSLLSSETFHFLKPQTILLEDSDSAERKMRGISSIIVILLLAATGSFFEIDPATGSDQPKINVTGMVYNVVDGDTFNVTDFGRVRLADVDSPEIETPEGEAAKLFTQLHLEGKTVHLDVDDSRGTDRYGRWICVVNIESPSGEVGENFNRMLVDDGFAVVTDYKDNEFDPLDWWPSLRRMVIVEVELNPAGDDTAPGAEWVKIFNRGR